MGSLAANRLGFLVVCLGVLVWVFFWSSQSFYWQKHARWYVRSFFVCNALCY